MTSPSLSPLSVQTAIRTKRAIRKFTPDPLPDDALHAILNAGRRAQSSKNMQAWHFIAIRDRATLEALSKCGDFAGHLAGAALGLAIITPDPEIRFNVMFDAGQSAAYMQLAAWELGIGSCLATIYQHDQARALLGFPADMHLRIALSFGYPLEPEKLTLPPRKTGRRTFDEVIHWDRWEEGKAGYNPFGGSR
ncbi:MAG: nitroreductase family protein [Anaerolineales bacterium]|nr:nitroreductase family protein [Anaerolineales bacterium]